jgi:MazG family protein
MEHPPFDTDLAPLLDLVARLRAPDGCPWDRKQTMADVRAYLLEEAHEAAAALDAYTGGDREGLREELGDLLFQVCFVLELAREEGAFTAAEVIGGIHRKMVERHPHVFGDEVLEDAGQVAAAWESRKARSRRAQGAGGSLLDGVPSSLPSLLAAYRMTQKAAGVGFDWPDAAAVTAKLEEELEELDRELAAGEAEVDEEAVTEELGDVLFTVANLSRKLGRDPEAVLAAANAKFRRRFAHVERRLEETGRPIEEATLEEMEELWGEAKGERVARG